MTLCRESAHTFMTSAQVPSSFSEPGGPPSRASSNSFQLACSLNFNTSASHFSGGLDGAPRKESESGVKVWVYWVLYAQCPISFSPAPNGECKVESDADVSGALGPVGIEDIDFGPYLAAGEVREFKR